MRIKSQLWVAAYVRRCEVQAIPAMIVRRGDADAGAIFIKLCLLDGTARLFGPAPTGISGADSERQWVSSLGELPVSEAEVDRYLIRQRSFDSDLWIIEVEDKHGRHLLDDAVIKA